MFETTNVAATVGQGVPQFDALKTIGNLAETQNALNQNRMFQAKARAGQYLADSADANGNPDPVALRNKFAADPMAAMAAPEIMSSIYSQQGQAISNTTSQQGLAAARAAAIRSAIASIPPSKNPDPEAAAREDKANALTAAAPLVQSGVVDRDTFDSLAALPADQFETARMQAMIGGAGGTYAQTANFGAVTPIATGGGTKLEAVNPVKGTVAQIGETIPNTLGPGDLASRVETTNPDGSKKMGVLGDFVNPDASWKSGVPHPLTAIDPLSQAANAGLGAGYASQIANFEQTAAASATQRQTIENLRQEAAGFDTGPNADAWSKLGELLSEYKIKPPDGFASATPTAAAEAFKKSMTMLMGAQQQALHMDQTDASRQTAQAAVPGIATTPEGRRQVLGILEGNADMLNAAGKAWQAQKDKGGPASWGQFQMEFPNRVPPSIFQSQYMTPGEIATMQKGWSKAKIDHWNAVKAAAQKLGWLQNAQ